MESLLAVSALLLYTHYYSGTESHDNSTPIGETDDSEIATRSEEYEENPGVVQSYQPPWMRQFGATPTQQFGTTQRPPVSVVTHPADEIQEDTQHHLRARQAMGASAVQSLGFRTAGEGVSVEDSERVRPPRMGGFDGYDDERGRAPVPRYFRFDLGNDYTGDPLRVKDAGMSKGFAFGGAARLTEERPGNFSVRPDRDILMSADRGTQAFPDGNTWHRGEHDSTGRGQGPAAIQAKNYVLADDDPYDRRLRDEHVPSHNFTPGSSRVGSVFKHESLMDPQITRRLAIPGSDQEKPFDKTRGAALNPTTKHNYLSKATDYLQQPQPRHVDTNKQTPGISRFTKLHSTSSSVVRDKTQWTYTVNIKDARNLLTSAKSQQRKNRTGSEPILLSEEQRHAYKLDPKYAVERNLEAPATRSKGLAFYQGASKHSGMSYQYDTKNLHTVNSQLRGATTYESPQLTTGGAEKVPVHNIKVQSSFQAQNTSITPKQLSSISRPFRTASSGAANRAIGQHPKQRQKEVTTALSSDKRAFTYSTGSGKVTVRPKDAVTARVQTVAGSSVNSLFDNEGIADTGGRLNTQGAVTPFVHRHRQTLDPGRQTLHQNREPVRRRR